MDGKSSLKADVIILSDVYFFVNDGLKCPHACCHFSFNLATTLVTACNVLVEVTTSLRKKPAMARTMGGGNAQA